MTIYSLDILLSQFGTSLLFHVCCYLLLLDLHTDFSGGSCLGNPMNSMKRQKDMILKDELPSLVGAQYATGEEWRNSSRRNEEAEPK